MCAQNPPLTASMFKRRALEQVLVLVVVLALTAAWLPVPSSAASAKRQRTRTRVLFIGNSFTFVNDLPHQLKNIAESLGEVREYLPVYTPVSLFCMCAGHAVPR